MIGGGLLGWLLIGHGKPAEGSSCACCFADFEAANYVEYQAKEGIHIH
jgi:hypothetical protein